MDHNIINKNTQKCRILHISQIWEMQKTAPAFFPRPGVITRLEAQGFVGLGHIMISQKKRHSQYEMVQPVTRLIQKISLRFSAIYEQVGHAKAEYRL